MKENEAQPITFKWSNYFKPTPKNLMFLTEGLKGIIVGVAGSSFYNDHKTAAFYMLIGILVLDLLMKFFSRADADYKE